MIGGKLVKKLSDNFHNAIVGSFTKVMFTVSRALFTKDPQKGYLFIRSDTV